jgi:anti-repressor protein
VYLLTKRDTYVIVAQLSPAFTARLVDRWQALENAPPPATLTGPQLMAAALIEANTTMQAQALQIADMREDVDALARLDAAEGDLTRREASKVLKYPEHKLGKWLELNRWAFRQSGKGPIQAYVEKRNIGYLTHKLGTFEHEGELKTSITMMITPKGMARLAKVLPVDARGVQP